MINNLSALTWRNRAGAPAARRTRTRHAAGLQAGRHAQPEVTQRRAPQACRPKLTSQLTERQGLIHETQSCSLVVSRLHANASDGQHARRSARLSWHLHSTGSDLKALVWA